MEVRRYFRVFLGLLITPLLLSVPVQALDKNSVISTQLLAGAIGKRSSATARVTLVIPPRPKSKPQAITDIAEVKPTVEAVQKAGNRNPPK